MVLTFFSSENESTPFQWLTDLFACQEGEIRGLSVDFDLLLAVGQSAALNVG